MSNSGAVNVGEFAANNGTPAWEAIGSDAADWQVAGAGDLLGNGADDVPIRDTTSHLTSGDLGLFVANDGTPTWEPPGWAAATNWQTAGTGDLLFSGADDVLFRDSNGGNVGTFGMHNGTAAWQAFGIERRGYGR